MLDSALPMGLEPNRSSDRTAAVGVCRVAAMCGVRLSSATWYASTERRLWMCKRGSCTIAHALRLWWRRRGRGCRAGPSSVDVADSPPASAKGAGALQALLRMVLSGASYPGRWVESYGYPSRVAPAEPTRAVGEVRRVGVNRTALEGRAAAYSRRQVGRTTSSVAGSV